jgi:hypothetical protein
MTPDSPQASLPPLDAHVHLVGNGRSGSGCWLRVGGTWWQRPLAAYMLGHIGLADSALDAPDFDDRFATHLLHLVNTSSLGAICLLAQDAVYSADGSLRTDRGTFYVPNDRVFDLARQHPRILPVVSIHPARRDAFDELERCLALGAVMLKLLPNCHDVNPSDPRHKPFWERMAEAGLPLLAHTGGEHTVEVIEPAYADPRTLQLPLECGVTVIAAHAATRSGLRDPDYFPIWAAMLEQWPNLYGDTSAWNVPLRGRHAARSTVGLISQRLLHGSDFPVPVNGLWARLRGLISDRDWQQCGATANVLERDYQLKRAMGFSPEHFTRAWHVLRLTHSHPARRPAPGV